MCTAEQCRFVKILQRYSCYLTPLDDIQKILRHLFVIIGRAAWDVKTEHYNLQHKTVKELVDAIINV